jgi:hypothetical protein
MVLTCSNKVAIGQCYDMPQTTRVLNCLYSLLQHNGYSNKYFTQDVTTDSFEANNKRIHSVSSAVITATV